MNRLLELAKTLRDPENGCPWDQVQTFDSYKKCLVEETEEVIAAIEAKDFDNLKEEIGDTLFNLIFLVNLAEEQNLFTLDSVISDAHQKLVERHPHVFGEEKASSPEEALRIFNEAKEKQKKTGKSK